MRSRRYPHAIHYALKANSTLAIARLLRSLGSSADANSGGEIDVALRAGFIPPQIVFTGVGKTSAELAQAIELGVRTINAESAGELDRIDALSRERQTRARIAMRVNPDIDARSHPHISTGLKTNKFGIPIDGVAELVRRARDLAGRRDRRSAQPRRIADPRPRAAAPGGDGAGRSRATPWARTASRIEHLDLGGGLGVSYDGSPDAVAVQAYADVLLSAVARLRPADHSRAGPTRRRAGRRAADTRDRRQGAGPSDCSS